MPDVFGEARCVAPSVAIQAVHARVRGREDPCAAEDRRRMGDSAGEEIAGNRQSVISIFRGVSGGTDSRGHEYVVGHWGVRAIGEASGGRRRREV